MLRCGILARGWLKSMSCWRPLAATSSITLLPLLDPPRPGFHPVLTPPTLVYLRRCILKALWSVCDQLYKLMSSERTGGVRVGCYRDKDDMQWEDRWGEGRGLRR